MSKQIALKSNGVIVKYAVVDDNDFELLSQWEWKYFKGKWGEYARRFEWPDRKVTTILMHRQIMNAGRGDYVDHINGDGLNNQRYNLRLCTNGQNGMNAKKHSHLRGLPTSSKFKGVSLVKRRSDFKIKKPWNAYFKLNGRRKSLGNYETEKEAAMAYNEAALKYYGEFAKINIF